jgi:hypothetical protein
MIVHGMTDTAATGANNVVCELMDLIIIVGVQEVRAWKRLRPMVLFCLTHCKVVVQILNSVTLSENIL